MVSCLGTHILGMPETSGYFVSVTVTRSHHWVDPGFFKSTQLFLPPAAAFGVIVFFCVLSFLPHVSGPNPLLRRRTCSQCICEATMLDGFRCSLDPTVRAQLQFLSQIESAAGFNWPCHAMSLSLVPFCHGSIMIHQWCQSN